MTPKKPATKATRKKPATHRPRDDAHHQEHHWARIDRAFTHLTTKLRKLMASIQELQTKITELDTKVDALQATIDADQASDAQVVADLTTAKDAADAEVARLQAIIDAGGTVTEADIQTAVDAVQAIADKIDAASTDVGGENPPPTARRRR